MLTFLVSLLFISQVQAKSPKVESKNNDYDRFKTQFTVSGPIFKNGQLDQHHSGFAQVVCESREGGRHFPTITMKMTVQEYDKEMGVPLITLNFSENGKQIYPNLNKDHPNPDEGKRGVREVNHEMRERYHSNHPPIDNIAILFYEILGGNLPVNYGTQMIKDLTPQDIDRSEYNVSNTPLIRLRRCAIFAGVRDTGDSNDPILKKYNPSEFAAQWLGPVSSISIIGLKNQLPVPTYPGATPPARNLKDKR